MLNKYISNKLAKAIVVFVLSILLAFSLYATDLRIENILLVFVVGILIIIVESSSFSWGIVSAILFVFTFNFFFTEPRFTFDVDDPNYLVSFAIFFIVAALVSTLMTRLQRQMHLAKHSAAVSENLYEISKGFWHLNDEQGIVAYASQAISGLLKRECLIFIMDRGEQSSAVQQEAVWCFENSFPCGQGETKFSKDRYKYLPIRSESSTLGVVRVDCAKIKLSSEDERYLNTVIFQLTIALERYRLNISEEENRVKIARENLRSNLLRSISHDLRTPLTGIAGGSGLLLDNIQNMDMETVKSVLKDINEDALWLSSLVENLLNMTRIQDGRLTVQRKLEVVDDVIAEVVGKVSKRSGEHTLNLQRPADVILAPMDAQLIIQVLINVLDNAFRHTEDNSVVELSYKSEQGKLIIEISDNGKGIAPEALANIFEPFYSTAHGGSDQKRGMGLGLSICKAIIVAHEGSISAMNNRGGGATFKIVLPLHIDNKLNIVN